MCISSVPYRVSVVIVVALTVPRVVKVIYLTDVDCNCNSISSGEIGSRCRQRLEMQWEFRN